MFFCNGTNIVVFFSSDKIEMFVFLSSLGGLLPNSDYGQRPSCFDTCHLHDGSSAHHSVSSSSSSSVKNTTATCFEIKLFSSSPSPATILQSSFNESSSFNRTSNASLSASAISIISLTWSSIFVNLFTFVTVVFRRNFCQE